MPLLHIPESGLSFDSVSAPKSGSTTQPDIIGLTLTDDLIEQMIQCVQNGKPIQLSLGPRPNLSFGNTTQQLSSYRDPFPHELYHHDPSATSNMKMKEVQIKPVGTPHVLFQRMFSRNWKPEKAPTNVSAGNITKSVTAGVDSARETLEKQMALEKARKEENTTKLINAAVDPKRGAALKGSKSKFLSTPKGRLNDATRSLPSSPALSGIGSPLLAPTSVPTSQLLTEQAKSKRKAIVHLLAFRPMSEGALRDKVDDLSDDEFTQALNKVADKNTAGEYELLKNYYKELDVWTFNYDTEEDRQLAIDNAVKQYDRLRIPQNDDEWERLKPMDQRGDGKSLSKVQARIAQGPIPRTPRINVSNTESGAETEEPGNKALAKVKNDTKRSSSQPPSGTTPSTTTKAKRVTEKEAQSKRLLSTKKKPAASSSITVVPKKEAPSKTNAKASKPLSNQFVTDSDDEEASKPIPPPKRPSPAPKRSREDEASSDSSQPLMKKVRPNKPAEHRPSDAQNSQSSSSIKSKGTSPPKSSPLASSPPTNASDFASSSSDTSTPRHRTTIGTKISRNRSPIHKRNASSSSLSTTSSTSSTISNYTRINPNVMQLAAKFRCYYPSYAALHRELSGLKEGERDMDKHEKLLDMHDRLVRMKKEIKEASLSLA